MHFVSYNKSLKEFSRDLRSHSTLSEVLLWQKLKASQFRGYAFNRQRFYGVYLSGNEKAITDPAVFSEFPPTESTIYCLPSTR